MFKDAASCTSKGYPFLPHFWDRTFYLMLDGMTGYVNKIVVSIDYIFLAQINILSCTFMYYFTGAIFCNTSKKFNKTFKIKQLISTHVLLML